MGERRGREREGGREGRRRVGEERGKGRKGGRGGGRRERKGRKGGWEGVGGGRREGGRDGERGGRKGEREGEARAGGVKLNLHVPTYIIYMFILLLTTVQDPTLVPRPPLTAFFHGCGKNTRFFHSCKKAARGSLGTKLTRSLSVFQVL